MKKLISFYKRLSFFQGAAFAVSMTSIAGLAANNIPGFFTFTSGTVISSSQINSNFDKLANLIESNQSQVYHGTWDASTNNPDIFSAPPSTGGYYITNVAGTYNSVSYNIGDWVIWNGTTWNRIQSTSGVSNVFGRTGSITKMKGDYNLVDLGDTDNTLSPMAGQVLQFDGTKWTTGNLPTLTETDPSVMGFAKTTLPTCSTGQVLKSSSGFFVCSPVFASVADKVVVTNAANELSSSSISMAQLGYLSAVTSDIQTQINNKSNLASFIDWTIGGVQTIEPTRLNLMMPNRVVVTNSGNNPVYSTVMTSELNYLSGVTSPLQTQIDSKLNIVVPNPTLATDAVNKGFVDSLFQSIKFNGSFVGVGSNSYLNTANYNSFFGANAGLNNTSGYENTHIGFESGFNASTGYYNTSVGSQSLRAAGGKNYSTAIGYKALYAATTGTSNTAIGSGALSGVTTGNNNTAVGKQVASSLISGSGNTFLGYGAGSYATAGDNNVVLGYNAGPSSGSYNILIGTSVGSSLAGNNNVVIGGNISGLASLTDTIILATGGDPAVERLRINASGNVGIGTNAPTEKLHIEGNLKSTGTITAVAVTQTSDIRLKKDIISITSALKKVLGLRGVEFNWKKDNQHEVGFIAQEVEKVIPELVVTNSEGMKSVKYANVVPLLVESTRETDAKIVALEKENKMLKSYLCSKDPSAPFCH